MFKERFIQTTESRSNNLDVLRFLLACVVIHSHSFMLTGHEYTSLRQKLIHLQFGGGGYAVDFFFMLSGFLVANSWLRSRGLGDYLKRRVLRIYPGFIVCLAFCVFVVGPLSGVDLKAYFTSAQTYAFFRPLILGPLGVLPGVFADAPWPGVANVPLWTIRFEFACYLLLAVIGMAGVLRRRRMVVAIFVAALAVFAIQKFERSEIYPLELPLLGAIEEVPRFVAFFFGGVVFYLYRDVIPQSGGLALAALAGLGLGAGFHCFDIALAICGTYLIFYVGFHPGIRFHNFAKHGDFSYGMYLYGFAVQQLMVRHVPLARHPLMLTLLAVCGAFALAMLSWHFVEKPFLKFKNARGKVVVHGAAPLNIEFPETAAIGKEAPQSVAHKSALSLAR